MITLSQKEQNFPNLANPKRKVIVGEECSHPNFKDHFGWPLLKEGQTEVG